MPMSRRELDEFLAAPRLAHFATFGPDGAPWVRPVWYVWADSALYFTTRLRVRRTGADVDAGSAVAVSIASEDHPYRAVLARGSVEVWTTDRDAWLERIARRYGTYPGWYDDALREDDRVVTRLAPDTLVSWDYGKGDYEALNAQRSLRTTI
jgi:PPOX class probable F420-dependent enzyme